MWFSEDLGNFGIRIKTGKKLFEYSGMQNIQIFDTEFGKMLILDGKVQLIEEFESSYHEMLVHVPMITHPHPKKVLIIGGGDGGTVREVLKHDPDSVIMVEIDKDVVDACKEYIGIDNDALNDRRVKILFEDGVKFVKNTTEKFDVLIVDGTDPTPVSEPLFTRDFYINCSRISDYFCIQSQSPILQREEFERVYLNTNAFDDRAVYLSFVPMYPGGMWSFILCSSEGLPIKIGMDEINERFLKRSVKTEYYNPEVHRCSFSLPQFIKSVLDGSG